VHGKDVLDVGAGLLPIHVIRRRASRSAIHDHDVCVTAWTFHDGTASGADIQEVNAKLVLLSRDERA